MAACACRTLRTKFDELERHLDAAHRAQRAEEEHSRQLAAQVERLQGRLKDVSTKQAELSQQLWWVLGVLGLLSQQLNASVLQGSSWRFAQNHSGNSCTAPLPAYRDKAAAHNELSQQHRELQEDSKALAASNAQLQAALATSQQRAQQAETLAVGLQAEWQAEQAEQAGQAALQEEAERLRAELQQASFKAARASERWVHATSATSGDGPTGGASCCSAAADHCSSC